MSVYSSRISKAIAAAQLSYGDIAKQTQIPKSALQRYATGQTEKIPIDRLEQIAKVLHVDAAYLIGWQDEPIKTSNINQTAKNGVALIGNGNNVSYPMEDKLLPQLRDLMRIYMYIGSRRQIKLMTFAYELEEEEKAEQQTEQQKGGKA